MSSSLIAMAPGRKHSRLRLPSTCDHLSSSPRMSHLSKSSNFMDRMQNDDVDNISPDEDDMTNAEEKNNNSRMPTAYLSKMLDSKDFLNDVDGSPSPAFLDCESNNFMFPTQKPITNTPLSKPGVQKMSSSQKKNRASSIRQKPVEMFRKDLISAMKIPDNQQLCDKYWIMQDPWKIEWEKGVQVPVNTKAIHNKNVSVIPKATNGDFRMPRKMLKSCPDNGDKDMIDFNVLADNTCRYDLDELDVCWLKENNEERKLMGLQPLDEFSMEQIMEELETQCHDNLQKAIQNKEEFGIEYDEDVVCDVCRLLDCEEGNEMVFCDGCNLCVHQACYGILKVPEGGWLCRPCSLGIQGSTQCILCNKKGGAMKSTRSGNKWAHVSCALWIPEISIMDPERMEPIAKVSHIPASRWALCCNICKERVGACIQCSVKHCVVAYHVTCAIESKLDMVADYGDIANGMDDAVIFRSYCKKHSKNRKESDSENDEKKEEHKRSLKFKRIMEMSEDFSNLVKCEEVASTLSVPLETTVEVIEYWKLKRRAQFDRPLITPKHEEGTALADAAETNLQRRLRMFTHLRQDLERVRNLCYMIGKREKTKRMTIKNMESVFLNQMKVLERQMADNPRFDSTKIVKNLARFGQPEVCRLAKKESFLLAKAPEWSEQRPPAENKKPEKVPKVTSVSVVSESDKIKPKKLNSIVNFNKEIVAGNELDRKTNISTHKKNNRLQSNLPKYPSKNSKSLDNKQINSPSRKRSLPMNSSSDFESENQMPVTEIPHKTRRNKTQNWSTWNSTGATASPSAFQVKSEKPLATKTETKANALTKSHTIKKAAVRQTRASGIFNKHEKSPKLSLDTSIENKNNKRWKTTTRSDLEEQSSMNWDFNNTPDNNSKSKTLKSKNKSKILDKSQRKETDCKSNGHLSNDSIDHSSTSCSSFTRSKSNGFSQPGNSKKNFSIPHRKPSTRESALKAKNESGALAQLCDSGKSNAEIEVGPLSAQELRKIHTSTSFQQAVSKGTKQRKLQKNQSRASTSRSEDINSFYPKEDDDGGYKGDMDETESDSPPDSSVSHKKVFHSVSQSRMKSATFSDSANTTDSNAKQTAKSHGRRRFRNIQNRRRKDSTLIVFKGFRDIIDSSKSQCSSVENKVTNFTDKLSPPAIKKELVAKNELAVGDVCVDTSILMKDKYFRVADGQNPPTISQTSTSHLTQEPTNFDQDLTLRTPLLYPGQNFQMPNQNFSKPFVYEQNQFLVQNSKNIYPHGQNPQLSNPQPMPFDQNYHQINTENNTANYPPMLNNILPSNLTHEQKTVYMQHLSQYLFGKSFESLGPNVPRLNTFENPQMPLLSNAIQQPDLQNLNVKREPEQLPINNTETPLPVPLITGTSGSIVTPNQDDKANPEEPTTVDQPQSDNSSQVSKKKSKKSKKKKKKKKRKLSQESDKVSNCEGSGLGFDDYCVEYCSILDPAQAEELGSQLSDSTAHEEILSNATTTDVIPNITPPIKSEKLLLKIDRSRIVDMDNPAKSAKVDPKDNLNISSPEQSRPFVSPLKLKLCGQKSDRTLRNGLKPCEYQILDGEDPDPTDNNEHNKVESKITLPQTNKPKPKAVAKSSTGEVKKRGRPRKIKEEPKTLPTQVENPATSSNILNSDNQKPFLEEQTSPQQCHWKKRKVREHETSVTVDIKSDDSENRSQIKSLTATTMTAETANIESKLEPNHKQQLPQPHLTNTELPLHSGMPQQDMIGKKLTTPIKPTSYKLNSQLQKTSNNSSKESDPTPSIELFNKTKLKFLKEEKKLSLTTQNIKTEAIDPYEFGDFGS